VIYRCIAPKWLDKPVLEGEFTDAQIKKYNADGYNIYTYPNHPETYKPGVIITGADITVFRWVFVDMDLKDGRYGSKEAFIEALGKTGISPTKIVDSGNGVHVYWRVSNLDAMSYLRFQRRLIRLLNTDETVCQIFQLMRLPGMNNTKDPSNPVKCVLWYDSHLEYTAEELDKLLPPITIDDETSCQRHYDRTYGLNQEVNISDTLPPKFGKFIQDCAEAKELFAGNVDDRSKGDYRLGHLMFANGFTRDEALSVLVNSAKALTRAPVHRRSYASNIVDKIWTYELAQDKAGLDLSDSIEAILKRPSDTLKGTPLRCHKRIDNTKRGFRLGDVIGLVAGSGVGKTAFALNMFRWFSQENPDYHHFFIPLEQPANEIADRWQTMCGEDTALHSKIHVMSNYDADGGFRHLSLDEIKDYIQKWQQTTGNKIGCIVIDHIGALKKKGANDEKQDLITICHSMKSFAIQTNTLLVMQSQTSREKAGIGDLELNKDAAYGTLFFEAYCDYLITLWQPLKRCHKEEACPTVTAFKFCKIRHKKAKSDVIQEDVPYYLYFDSERELLQDMTQEQETSFNFFLPKATNKRKLDRKTEILEYVSAPKDGNETRTSNNRQH
jgi:KaiC